MTVAFMAEYCVLPESCTVMNSSADLYVAALNVMMFVALDPDTDTDVVSDLATPPVTNALLSAPVIANILAPECGALVKVMFVPDTV
jgi:hypothetical protein